MTWAETASPRLPLLILGCGIIMLVVVVHYPTLDNFGRDDDVFYLSDYRLHSLSDIGRFLTLHPGKTWLRDGYDYGPYGQTGGTAFRPTAYLYFALLTTWFGDDVSVARTANLVIYLAVTVLVFIFVLDLSAQLLPAAITSALFAIDPLREYYIFTVASHGGLPVLYFGAVYLYTRGRLAKRPRTRYGLSVLAYSTAVLAHLDYELAISLPLAISFVEWFYAKILNRWRLNGLVLIPYYLIAVFYFILTFVTGEPEYGPHFAGMANAGIQFATRAVMLFLPNAIEWRSALKEILVADMPGYRLVAAKPWLWLTAGAAGVVLAGAALLRFFAWERRARVLQDSWYGRLLLFGTGWSLIGMLPAVIYNHAASRHLLISLLGSNLLKAVVVIAIAEAVGRRWRTGTATLSAIVLAPVLVYDVAVFQPYIKDAELCDAITKNAIADVGTVLDQSARKGQPVTVYYLNAITFGEQCGVQFGYNQILQRALNRESLTVMVPYRVNLKRAAVYPDAVLPSVKVVNDDAVLVVNNDAPRRFYSVGLGPLNPAYLRKGLTFSNGTTYTIAIQEIDDVNKNPLVLRIQFHRSPRSQTILLRFEDGHLRPIQDIPASG